MATKSIPYQNAHAKLLTFRWVKQSVWRERLLILLIPPSPVAWGLRHTLQVKMSIIRKDRFTITAVTSSGSSEIIIDDSNISWDWD